MNWIKISTPPAKNGEYLFRIEDERVRNVFHETGFYDDGIIRLCIEKVDPTFDPKSITHYMEIPKLK